MRLFIAINFNDDVKEKIQEIREELEKHSFQGRFVYNENLHLTLEFLGEIPPKRVDDIKRIMDNIDFKAFVLKLSNIGYFKRPDGNIFWIGIEDSEDLYNLQRNLHSMLANGKFKLEDKPYKPHITLGRKVKLRENYDYSSLDNKLKDIAISVDRIDLMKSETINEKLTYSVIYSKCV